MDINFGDLAKQAQSLATEHGDAVADAVDKATDFVDDKTGGKFTSQLDSVDDAARNALTKNSGESE